MLTRAAVAGGHNRTTARPYAYTHRGARIAGCKQKRWGIVHTHRILQVMLMQNHMPSLPQRLGSV
jgi:hypothetical protein